MSEDVRFASPVADSKILDAALAWQMAGCSVIPIAANGTKRPMIKWEDSIYQAAGPDTVYEWFTNWPNAGIGLVCGAVSGDLEMLELEGRATTSEHLDAVVAKASELGIYWLWDLLTQQGYAEWTPSGGIHLIYRISDSQVPGNTKIAADESRLCLAETRGQGGYVVVAPSGGTVHQSGDSWSVAAGEIGTIPTVTWADRCLLVQAVKEALDKTPPAPVFERKLISSPRPAGTLPPGEDYAAQVSWHDILAPLGWRIVREVGTETLWLHPDSASGSEWSASTGYKGSDNLYVWSTSTIFKAEEPYTKFAAYTLINHGGNFSAATKDLSAKGYGSPLEPKSQSSGDRFLLDSVQADRGQSEGLGQQIQALPHTAASDTPSPVTWRKDFPAPRLTVDEFLAEDFTLHGAGNLYAQAFENAFKYCESDWWFWTGKIWKRDKRSRFEEAAKSIIDIGRIAARQATVAEEPYAKALTTHINKMANAQSPAIPKWARSDQRISIEFSDFDAQAHLVALDNGCFNLHTMTLEDHNPATLVTRQMPIVYDKDALCPQWETFLAQAIPDPEIRDYLQRAMGHTLLGDAEQRALFLLHGPSGTGKSQFIRMMELLFGDFAETATPATFNSSSKTTTLTNDLNDLRGKRFVSLSELDEGEVLNESLVKRLTGGDTAKSRGLWQENAKWRVQFTLWLATNNLPKLNSDDNAIWRRVKPILFGHVAEEKGEEILRLADKVFAQEASGVFNWLLAGVEAYRLRGLADLDQIKQAVTDYRKEVDVVEQFMASATEDSLVVAAEGTEIQSSRLYTIYTSWCQRNQIKGVLAQRRFSQRIARMGYESRRTSAAIFWIGIGGGSHGLLGSFP